MHETNDKPIKKKKSAIQSRDSQPGVADANTKRLVPTGQVSGSNKSNSAKSHSAHGKVPKGIDKSTHKSKRVKSLSAANARSNPSSTAKSATTAPHIDTRIHGLTESDRLPLSNGLHIPADNPSNPDSRENEDGMAISYDPNKVKVQFSVVRPHIKLPQRTKKLMSAYVEVRDQFSMSWKDSYCAEETTFFERLCKKSGCDARYARARTAEALTRETSECLRICTRAMNLLDCDLHLSQTVTTKKRHVSDHYMSVVLGMVQELMNSVERKYAEIIRAVPLKFQSGSDVDLQNQLPIRARCRDLEGLYGDTPSPVETICYKSVASVRKYYEEKLTHRCLIVEKELVQRVSDCYLRLIERMAKREKGDVPSSEFVHVLQNFEAVLGEDGAILPAFVLAD